MDLGGQLLFAKSNSCTRLSYPVAEDNDASILKGIWLCTMVSTSEGKSGNKSRRGPECLNLSSLDLGGAGSPGPAMDAGDAGSIPGPGRSHMLQSNPACAPQLLSLCTGLVLCNKSNHCDAEPTHCSQSSPRSPKLEKAPGAAMTKFWQQGIQCSFYKFK